jgi:hypothetical protein
MDCDWHDSLRRFALAPLTLLAEREMNCRTDSKFVMPVAAAHALLSALRDDYAVLPAGAALVAVYSSLYFDTVDLELFHAHRRDRRIRQKVRVRHYPDRAISILEVKMQTRDGLTVKQRLPRAYGDVWLCPDDLRFVETHCPTRGALQPQALTDYRRVTLLGTRTAERVTIDFDLCVTRGVRGRRRLRHLAVVEVKQPRLDRSSAVMRALRAAGRREGWASKYCAAIALTSPEVRANRLRVGLRALERVGTWAS